MGWEGFAFGAASRLFEYGVSTLERRSKALDENGRAKAAQHAAHLRALARVAADTARKLADEVYGDGSPPAAPGVDVGVTFP